MLKLSMMYENYKVEGVSSQRNQEKVGDMQKGLMEREWWMNNKSDIDLYWFLIFINKNLINWLIEINKLINKLRNKNLLSYYSLST